MSFYIIGKGFLGSQLYAYLDDKKNRLVSHDEVSESEIRALSPKLIINAAAIAGQRKCEAAGKQETFSANIDFALGVAKLATQVGSQCLQFSSAGVYAKPHSTPKRESHQRNPNNLYIESKIIMEDALKELDVEAIIFRVSNIIGFGDHESDFRNRIRQWQWVQSAYSSLVSIETLVAVIQHIAIYKVSGIFNIAEGFVYLPSYVAEHYKKLPIQKDSQIPSSFTQSHILDTTKARMKGILL